MNFFEKFMDSPQRRAKYSNAYRDRHVQRRLFRFDVVINTRYSQRRNRRLPHSDAQQTHSQNYQYIFPYVIILCLSSALIAVEIVNCREN